MLKDLCDKLPEEDCYRGEEKPQPEPVRCGKHEFNCGDECVDGLSVCDNRYDCHNGADELHW